MLFIAGVSPDHIPPLQAVILRPPYLPAGTGVNVPLAVYLRYVGNRHVRRPGAGGQDDKE